MQGITRRIALGTGLLLPAVARAQEVGAPLRPLRVGVTAGPQARVMERVRTVAARRDGPAGGLAIRIVEVADPVQPNLALVAGELDANSYQHGPFLEQQVRERALPLAAVGKTLIFPMGLYSRRRRALTEVPAGSRVAIPEDAANGGRALMLLAGGGMFELRPGAEFGATVDDIVANPGRIQVVELAAARMPGVLDQVEAAAINSTFAVAAGLNPLRDAIRLENGSNPYANLLVVRLTDRTASWVPRLLAAYQSAEVRGFIRDTFQGAVIAAF